MISRKVAHQALNRLQVILGQIELAAFNAHLPKEVIRHLENAKKELTGLSNFIRESTTK